MKSVFALVVVAGLVSHGFAQTKSGENVAATVNGETIRLDEVDSALKTYFTTDAPLTTEQTKRLRDAILDELIDERLVMQFLAQNGPAIPPADIEKMMQALTASLRKQNKTLAMYFQENGQTEQQVRENWTRVLQMQRLVERQATEAELKKYYEAHRDVFENVKLRVSHIVIRLNSEATPSERASAIAKLNRIRDEITKGELDFAAAARKHSICPSARTGGDLGLISRADSALGETFAAAAFALEIGAVSQPVETEQGIHLIKAIEKKPGTPTTFEKSIDHVRAVYTEEVRRNLIAKLRATAKIQRSP